jgi:hypothetical protein
MIDTDVGNFCAALDVVNTTTSTKQSAREFRSETDLEHAIEAAKQRMCAATDWDEKLVRWREWVRLMDQRSIHMQRFLKRLAEMNSPPSTSARIAQASAECSGNAAGGAP